MMNMILALLTAFSLQTATVHCTYNDVVCFETQTGERYECYGWVDNPTGDYLLVMAGDAVVEFVEVQ